MSKTIIGLLTVVLSQFVPVEELEVVLQALGILLAWYGRVQAVENITWYGMKK